jgi:hypothetical protein
MWGFLTLFSLHKEMATLAEQAQELAMEVGRTCDPTALNGGNSGLDGCSGDGSGAGLVGQDVDMGSWVGSGVVGCLGSPQHWLRYFMGMYSLFITGIILLLIYISIQVTKRISRVRAVSLVNVLY